MWPKLSQINDKIYKKITTRNNKDVSQLNIWVRLFSGVGDGLIMVSNPDTKLFASAGQSGIYGFGGNSEFEGYSGALGVDWNGKGVNPKVGRSLKPSPIVTSLEVKEGEDQISKEATIELTAFSLEQMEAIQKYFMEPGYNLFIEWGWNTEDGVRGLIKTDNIYNIPGLAASDNLKQKSIRYKHLKTNGDYDSFLGFIVGGSVSGDGESFSVTVELRGTPSLPTYLQNQNNIRKIRVNEDGDGKVEVSEASKPYDSEKLVEQNLFDEGNLDVARDRRFRNFYNSLPAHRQTEKVKNLRSTFTINDLINCDKVISDSITTGFVDRGFWKKFASFNFSDSVDVEGFDVDRAKLFSNESYIRFGKAIDILNKSSLNRYNVGGVSVETSIDISDTIIGAFPLIYSTNPNVLLIPGKIPDFAQYFLTTNEVTYASLINGGNGLDNKIGNIRFVESNDLNRGNETDRGGYYGYLKNLYINVDFFTNKLLSKNKNFKDILFDILNDMSAAVNSFWNFQITETADDDNDDSTIKYKIIDRNWVGKEPGPPKEFYHSGAESRFLNATLNIDIPGEMANQIINKRLGRASQTDAYPIGVNNNTFFAKGVDRFLRAVDNDSDGDIEDGDIGERDINDLTSTNDKQARIDANQTKIDEIESKIRRGKSERKDGLAITPYLNEFGEVVYSTLQQYGKGAAQGESIIFERNTPIGREYERLNNEINELSEGVKNDKKRNLDSNIDKVEAMPLVTLVTEPEINEKTVKNEDFFRQNFRVYTCKNTDLLDYLKNDGALKAKNKGRLSQPLPIKYSFTVFGTSGIQRGDMFNVNGIPSKYKKKGLFQITGLEHSIEGSKWVTKVEALYRQRS